MDLRERGGHGVAQRLPRGVELRRRFSERAVVEHVSADRLRRFRSRGGPSLARLVAGRANVVHRAEDHLLLSGGRVEQLEEEPSRPSPAKSAASEPAAPPPFTAAVAAAVAPAAVAPAAAATPPVTKRLEQTDEAHRAEDEPDHERIHLRDARARRRRPRWTRRVNDVRGRP